MSKAELKDFTFKSRHLGPTNEEEAFMLQCLGFENSEDFISSVIPNEIFDLENNVIDTSTGLYAFDNGNYILNLKVPLQ